MISLLVAAGAGFLLAVLWFDLMHDVQVRGHDPSAPLPEPVLASIAAYYARVTTGARPMNALVGGAMLGTLAAVVAQLVSGAEPAWIPWASLAATGVGVGTAASRTVRNARRLGARGDEPAEQSRLARAIHADHRLCFAAIATLLALQLGLAAA